MRWFRTPFRIMDTLVQDLRYATRQLAGRPAFAVVMVLTLALGIGATTTVFSIANWIALRPVPGVRDQARLVSVELLDKRGGGLTLPQPVIEDLGVGTPTLEG